MPAISPALFGGFVVFVDIEVLRMNETDSVDVQATKLDSATPSAAASGLTVNAQVRFAVSAADEMQNKRHDGRNKKNMNQSARHRKNNPAKEPRNDQSQEQYHIDTHKTSGTYSRVNLGATRSSAECN